MFASLGKYNKTITALVAGAIGWATLIVHSASEKITADEWIQGATALAIALGVWAVANTDEPAE